MISNLSKIFAARHLHTAMMAMCSMKGISTITKVEPGRLFVLLEEARKDQKDILEGNTNDNLYCRH